MPKISDPWDHHDWDSCKYVSQWADRQDQREAGREKTFRLMAKILPYDQEARINVLDLGAGYGALAQFLLNYFSNSVVVCQDGSEEMAKLGRKRMKNLKGRFKYALCDFSKPRTMDLRPWLWGTTLAGSSEQSSRAHARGVLWYGVNRAGAGRSKAHLRLLYLR